MAPSERATAPTTTPLLTVSVPLGLQYGANPGRIQVQGDGQGRRTTITLVDTTTVGCNTTTVSGQALGATAEIVTLWSSEI